MKWFIMLQISVSPIVNTSLEYWCHSCNRKREKAGRRGNTFILDHLNFLSSVFEHDQNESKTFHNNDLKTATTAEQAQTRMDPKLIIEPILCLKNEEESALLSKSSDPVLKSKGIIK